MITIKKCECGCSCNGCGRNNFDSTWTKKQVDTIFRVEVGNLINYVCEDCLAKLTVYAVAALNEQKDGNGE